MVTDLTCTTCGATGSYADAYVFDLKRTCIDETEHDWVEPMNTNIDVIQG